MADTWLNRIFGRRQAPPRQAPTWPPPAMPQHPWLTLVVGRRGYGKTWYSCRVLDAFPPYYGSTLAIDPVYVAAKHDPQKYLAGHADRWATLPPAALTPGVGLVAVDEADRYLPTAQGHRDGLLADLVLRGRHHGTSLLLCTQRPALVGTDVRSQASRIVVFRLSSDDDIKAVVKIAPELRGRESEIERLPVGRALVWDAEHGAWPPAPDATGSVDK